MGLGQKLKIDIDQRLHRDGGVQGNRDKLIFFAVKSSALLLRKMRRKNGAVKTSELRSSVAKEDKEKNAW